MVAKTDHMERLDPTGQPHGLIVSEHRGRYLWAAQLAEGLDVLDAGCGTGYGLALLEHGGASRVVGVDIAAEAVARASELNPSERVEVRQADLCALPFADGSFDLVVCFETIEHLDQQDQAMSEVRRVLRPTGLLAISSPNRGVYPAGNPYHTHEFVPDELERMLANKFANIRLYRQSPWLAAAILDDEQSAAVSKGPMPRTSVIKLETVEPGNEVFTVALASDDPLPDPEALVTIGDPFELRWWHEQLDATLSERDHLLGECEQLHKKLRAERGLREEERSERGRALLAVEAQLAGTQSEIARLHASRADLEAWAEEQTTKQRELLRESARASEDFERRLRRAERTMDDITGSVSWRLTAPMRRIKRLFRRRA